MPLDARIYVAGHSGLAGSAIVRRLEAGGYRNIVTRTHGDLELMDQEAVAAFFQRERPEYVFLAAAKVGGIHANDTYPADFIYQNLMIQMNVIHAAYEHGVKRLLFLGSSCIYPKHAPQPLKEEYLLTGQLEPTNEAYAIAKIAGIEMCWAYNRQYGTRYLAVMPTNLYGPSDNYDLESSHVLPALIRKCHEAKVVSQSSGLHDSHGAPSPPVGEGRGGARLTTHDSRVTTGKGGSQSPVTSHQSPVVIWGTGKPRREFMYSDDLGDACVFLMNLADDVFDSVLNPQSSVLSPQSSVRGTNQSPITRYRLPPLINVGTGEDATVEDLARLAAEVVGYRDPFVFDSTKPDGTPRKLLDVSRMTALGWRARTGLKEGIAKAYADYLSRFGTTEAGRASSRPA